MSITVKFEGGRELENALQSLMDDFDASRASVRNVLRRGLVEAGQVTADAARNLAPDDPATPAPDLHTSIDVGTRLTPRQGKLNRSSKNTDRSFAEAYIGVTKEVNAYAHLVEFGTAHSAPRPFLRPAWEATKDAVFGRIKDAVTKQLNAAVKRAQRKALRLAGK
jgi:HK97 gp10 family phage protein